MHRQCMPKVPKHCRSQYIQNTKEGCNVTSTTFPFRDAGFEISGLWMSLHHVKSSALIWPFFRCCQVRPRCPPRFFLIKWGPYTFSRRRFLSLRRRTFDATRAGSRSDMKSSSESQSNSLDSIRTTRLPNTICRFSNKMWSQIVSGKTCSRCGLNYSWVVIGSHQISK